MQPSDVEQAGIHDFLTFARCVTSIEDFVDDQGVDYRNWRVGISSDAARHLIHAGQNINPFAIVMDAGNEITARMVLEHFKTAGMIEDTRLLALAGAARQICVYWVSYTPRS